MRFVRPVCAFLWLCACGTSSSPDAGADASSSTDAASDVVVSDPECLEAGAACASCCATNHPDASTLFDESMSGCACGTGTCASSCTSSFCANQTATKSCDSCISAKCYPNAKTACNGDPACAAWLACLVPCP